MTDQTSISESLHRRETKDGLDVQGKKPEEPIRGKTRWSPVLAMMPERERGRKERACNKYQTDFIVGNLPTLRNSCNWQLYCLLPLERDSAKHLLWVTRRICPRYIKKFWSWSKGTWKKMFHIINHWGDAKQNNKEVSSHTTETGTDDKEQPVLPWM